MKLLLLLLVIVAMMLRYTFYFWLFIFGGFLSILYVGRRAEKYGADLRWILINWTTFYNSSLSSQVKYFLILRFRGYCEKGSFDLYLNFSNVVWCTFVCSFRASSSFVKYTCCNPEGSNGEILILGIIYVGLLATALLPLRFQQTLSNQNPRMDDRSLQSLGTRPGAGVSWTKIRWRFVSKTIKQEILTISPNILPHFL